MESNCTVYLELLISINRIATCIGLVGIWAKGCKTNSISTYRNSQSRSVWTWRSTVAQPKTPSYSCHQLLTLSVSLQIGWYSILPSMLSFEPADTWQSSGQFICWLAQIAEWQIGEQTDEVKGHFSWHCLLQRTESSSIRCSIIYYHERQTYNIVVHIIGTLFYMSYYNLDQNFRL